MLWFCHQKSVIPKPKARNLRRSQCNAAGKNQIPQRLTPSRNDKTTGSRFGMTKLSAELQDEGDRTRATVHFCFSSAVQF
jgi:hypothetical protein